MTTLESRLTRLAVATASGLWVALAGLVVLPMYRGPMFGRQPDVLERPGASAVLVFGLIVAVVAYVSSRSKLILHVLAWGLAIVALVAAVTALMPPLTSATTPDMIAP